MVNLGFDKCQSEMKLISRNRTHFTYQVNIQKDGKQMNNKTHIEHREIIDSNHSTIKFLSDLNTQFLVGSKDTCSEPISSVIRKFDSLVYRLISHDKGNRRKNYSIIQ